MKYWIIVGALLLAGCAAEAEEPSEHEEFLKYGLGIEFAADHCGEDYPNDYTRLVDNGETLILDTPGDGSLVEQDQTGCVLASIEIPERVEERINQTNSLMGMEHASTDAYDLEWSYHPDNGLYLSVTKK